MPAEILYIRRNDKYHRFEQLSAALGSHVQGQAGAQVEYTGDFAPLQAESLAGRRCVIVCCMPYMDNHGDLLPEERTGLDQFVRGGGGLVVLHSGAGAWNGWSGWGELAGGVWDWGTSSHDPYGRFRVVLQPAAHPVAAAAAAALGGAEFETEDELYHTLGMRAPVTVVAHALRGGSAAPQAWVREVDAGRAFFCALGHDARSCASPGYLALVTAGVRWAGRLEG